MSAEETPEQFEQRTKWWREARFGMFIHWGIYAVPADATDLEGKHRVAEWYFSNKQMQVKDYEKFAAQFNPVRFNAKRWVQMAKDAGMKYIVITSKHHDGFCMFDSKLTDYTIVRATPFKRDPLKELAEECRKQGITFCFYHSIMDWHHPDYLSRRPWEKDTRPADDADLNRYINYMKGQLKELLTNYGPIGVLWFDGGWEHSAEELRSAEVNAFIRSLQPPILINNRNRLPEDFSTPEQFVPAKSMTVGHLWETCMTMNDTWGYATNDTNWKSSETLIRKLIDSAGKGGNFLLNVGPTAEGEFPPESIERLAAIGKWMKVNGESIHATTKGPFRRLSFDGRATTKGKTLYLHVFKWPGEGLKVTGLKTKIVSARALDGGESLRITSTNTTVDGVEFPVLAISKPQKLDPAATVIELRLAGPPVVDEPEPVVTAETDGSYILKAAEADIHGATAQYEVSGLHDYIGAWANPADYVTWTLNVSPQDAARRYTVEVTYSSLAQYEGSSFEVEFAGATLEGTVMSTPATNRYRTEKLGELEARGGRQTLAVRITQIKNGPAMSLHQVRLVPLP
ncbi:MAG TPA: alpha-L-fucosidase [Terriglobia bacterium]|nr:alpha-L-fucosidase [Terriglobia bacterium]